MTEPHRSPGRPRDPELDQAILRAAVEVMAEVGLQDFSVQAVADRLDISRATIYLRWKTRELLLGAVARAAGGGHPYPLSGDLADDYRRGAEFAREVTAGTPFIAVLPELVAAILAHPPQLSLDAVAPNRERLAAAYRAVAAEQGFDPAIDPNLAFDMILGAGLMQILANGRAASVGYMQQLAEVIIAAL